MKFRRKQLSFRRLRPALIRIKLPRRPSLFLIKNMKSSMTQTTCQESRCLRGTTLGMKTELSRIGLSIARLGLDKLMLFLQFTRGMSTAGSQSRSSASTIKRRNIRSESLPLDRKSLSLDFHFFSLMRTPINSKREWINASRDKKLLKLSWDLLIWSTPFQLTPFLLFRKREDFTS